MVRFLSPDVNFGIIAAPEVCDWLFFDCSAFFCGSYSFFNYLFKITITGTWVFRRRLNN
jgi:hypothetical protein